MRLAVAEGEEHSMLTVWDEHSMGRTEAPISQPVNHSTCTMLVETEVTPLIVS